MKNLNYTNNEIKLLNEGDYATFKVHNGEQEEVVKRKVHSIYKHIYGEYQYNTKGRNGGYGCDGYAFRNEDIIEIHK